MNVNDRHQALIARFGKMDVPEIQGELKKIATLAGEETVALFAELDAIGAEEGHPARDQLHKVLYLQSLWREIARRYGYLQATGG